STSSRRSRIVRSTRRPTSPGTAHMACIVAGSMPSGRKRRRTRATTWTSCSSTPTRSEEHTSELQSLAYLVCRLLLEKKNKNKQCLCLGPDLAIVTLDHGNVDLVVYA